MPVTLKKSQIKYKDPSTGNYVGVDAVAEKTTAEMVSEITTTAQTKMNALNTRATEIEASYPDVQEMEDMVAEPFVQSKAYPAGKQVIQAVDGVNKLFILPDGHNAGDAWGDTSKLGPYNLGDQVSDLKSAMFKNGNINFPYKSIMSDPLLMGTISGNNKEILVNDGCNIIHFTNSGSTAYANLNLTENLVNGDTLYAKFMVNASANNLTIRISGMKNGNRTTIKSKNVDAGWHEVSVSESISDTYDQVQFALTTSGQAWIKNIILSKSAIDYDYSIKQTVENIKPVVTENQNLLNGNITPDNFQPMLKNAFSYIYQSVSVTMTTGKYIKTDGTEANNSGSSYCSVSVQAGERYKIISRHGAAMRMYVLVDSSSNVVEFYPVSQVETLTETKEVLIPVNGTLYINTYSDIGLYIATKIVAGEIPKQNAWYLFGDSWSAADLSLKKWCNYVSEDLHLTLNNYAVSGTGYIKENGNGTYIGKKINDNLPSDFSGIITIFGSGNDCDGAFIPDSLGTSSDIYNPSAGTGNTVGGRINYAFSVIKTKAPLAKVIVLSPCPWQIYPPTTENNRMMQYIQMLKECTEKAGFIFVDMYYKSGLRPWDDTQASYWQESGEQGNRRVHPNANGHYFLYPQMMNEIMKIVPKQEQPT